MGPRPKPDPRDDLPVSNAYLTFAYMRAGKRKVYFENRNEVQRFLQELDETVCKPLSKTFCMRCSFLAEHHCQAKKPGVTVRDPLLMRKKVGPGDGDVVEELRYTSTIRLRLRKKDSAESDEDEIIVKKMKVKDEASEDVEPSPQRSQ